MNLREEKNWLEFNKILKKEESYFLDMYGKIKSKFGEPVKKCVACNFELVSKVESGFSVCSHCKTLNSNPRIQKKFLRILTDKDSSGNFFHQYVVLPSQDRRRMMLKERFDIFTQKVQKGKVLEIGCSIGLFSDFLSENGYDVECVELTPFSVELCKNKGLRIYDDYFENLNLEIESYDAIVFWEVLAHIFDPNAFLNKVRKLLKKGGLCFMSTPNCNSLEYDKIWEDNKRHHDNLKPHIFFQIFSKEGLIKLVENCNLDIELLHTPGKMDVANLCNYSIRNNIKFSNDFFNNIITGDEVKKTNFQNFLIENQLSGHMFVIIKK